MYCPKCGTFVPDNSSFCPQCGEQLNSTPTQTSDSQEPENEMFRQPAETATPAANAQPFNPMYGTAQPVENRNPAELKRLFSSKLFLAVCVLVSVATLFRLFSVNIDLIGILFTISCWITFANAASNSPISSGGYKFSSVILKSSRVLLWILVGICGLASVFMFIAAAAASSWAPQISAWITEYGYQYTADFGNFDINAVLPYLSAYGGITAAAVCAGIGVVLLLICGYLIFYNLFFVNSAVRYTDGLARAAEGTSAVPSGKQFSIRLLVIGIISAVTSFSVVTSSSAAFLMLSGLCSAAALIVAYVLLKND